MKLLVKTALTIFVLCLFCLPQTASGKTVAVHLKLSPSVCDKPLTGRVYVLVRLDVYSHPLEEPSFSESEPVFAMDVKDWKAGEEIVMTGDALSYTFPIDSLPVGSCILQAVLDTNTIERNFVDAPDKIPGKIYSRVKTLVVMDQKKNSVDVELDKKSEEPEIEETDFIRSFQVPSRLLSSFYKRAVTIKGAVILPPSYYQTPSRKYATVFVLPGFGTRYTTVFQNDFQIGRYGMNQIGLENVYVFLDLGCPLGFHEFANSDNNGPWSTALIEEFIPSLEKQFRVFPDPGSRFLTGQSSGAWAGLWLQINYPEQFGGVWAVSPDPVDFSAFLGTNIYDSGANFIKTKSGEPLQLNKILLSADRVIGEGWQMGSFESVFSPRGADGKPRRLWNRITGDIDPEVAATWKKYDIRQILESHWSTLASVLKGKIHIYVADDDTYGLDDPVRSLQSAMTAVNDTLDITILPKGAHNLWNGKMRETLHQQIDQIIQANHPEAAKK
jgi:hypothetical protein